MRSPRLMLLSGILLLAACSASPAGPPDGPVGSFKVTATTTGAGAKPTLLQLLVDDDPAVIIEANGSHVFEDVTVGELTARVVIPGHCSADHYAPRTVEIEEGVVTELTWSVRCPLSTALGIAIHRWPVAWIANADGSGGGPIGGPPGVETAWVSVLNPARTRLAFTSSNGSLAITDVDRAVTVTTELGRTTYADWSPDGEKLLIVIPGESVQDGGALVLVWADGVVDRTVRASNVRSVRWAPDGRRIAYREGAYIFVEDLESGARHNTDHILVGFGGEPAWSPDGTRLAFIDTYQQSIQIMDANGGNRHAIAGYTNTQSGSIDWGNNDLLLVLQNVPPSNYRFPHTVPVSGGNLVPLVNDGGSHDWARWAP